MNLEPEPTCETITPVEPSTIDIPKGVGPISLFAVAVSVTDPPTAGDVVLAASEIEYVLLDTRSVDSSAGLVELVPPGPVTVTSTAPISWELPGGAAAVIDVAEFTMTPVAALPPKATVSPAAKPAPAIVTPAPPDGPAGRGNPAHRWGGRRRA